MFVRCTIMVLGENGISLNLEITTLTQYHKTTISYCIAEFFEAHQFQNVTQGDITEFVNEEYKKKNGKYPRDLQRGVRLFYEQHAINGVNKITTDNKKDIWCYNPRNPVVLTNYGNERNFDDTVKKQVLCRAKNSCEICGLKQSSVKEKMEFDHWISFNHGGTNDVDNCVLLCRKCNGYKKNHSGMAIVRILLKNVMKLDHQVLKTNNQTHSTILELIEKSLDDPNVF